MQRISVLLRNYDLVRRAAGERGWLLVVPQGVADGEGRLSWNASAACCAAGAAGPDDVGYLRSVLADVRRHAAVDPLRVYAFGESNGGFMAHRWACEPGGELRAIASIAGAAPGPGIPPCAPAAPVSVLEVHGDRDERVRYEGGWSLRGRYPGARETIERWRALDGCAPIGRSARDTRLLFFAPLRVDSFACPSAAVELWTVEGGGHQLRGLRLWSRAVIHFWRRPVEQASGAPAELRRPPHQVDEDRQVLRPGDEDALRGNQRERDQRRARLHPARALDQGEDIAAARARWRTCQSRRPDLVASSSPGEDRDRREDAHLAEDAAARAATAAAAPTSRAGSARSG